MPERSAKAADESEVRHVDLNTPIGFRVVVAIAIFSSPLTDRERNSSLIRHLRGYAYWTLVLSGFAVTGSNDSPARDTNTAAIGQAPDECTGCAA